MATGVIKWFDVEKGFGFITPDDGSSIVFVRVSEIEDGQCPALLTHDRVDFEADARPHGLQASKITALTGTPSGTIASASK